MAGGFTHGPDIELDKRRLTAGHRPGRHAFLQTGTLEVAGGNLSITISFVPGTLSPETGVIVYLDTDEDARTGVVALRESSPIGADYVIRGLTPHDSAKASITQETAPSQSTFRGTIDVTSPAQNQRRIVVPLTRLGNDDGRLNFKVECYQVTAESRVGQTVTGTINSHIDAMPDNGASPGIVNSNEFASFSSAHCA